MLKEIWVCNVCGSPCRIEIEYSNNKMPEHLIREQRFRNRGCICKSEPFPDWRLVSEQGVEANEVAK